MPLQHTNRQGKIYHIQSHDRRGKAAITAAQKPTGTPVDDLPEGFEIHEKPETGQVYVRKIVPSAILASERDLVEAGLRQKAKLDCFLVQVEGDSLVVYSPNNEMIDSIIAVMRHFTKPSESQVAAARKELSRDAIYDKLLRFTLSDPPTRQFAADRWCFKGSINDWIMVGNGSLAALVNLCAPHLGKDSFFDLGGSIHML